PPGWVVKASLVALPTVTLNVELVAEVSPLLVAVSVYPVPALSILQPAKVTTPDDAVTGLVVHVTVPPPGLVPMAKLTLALELVTVSPPGSWTLTAGWVPHAVPPVPPPGWVVNASLAAGPTETLKVELVAELREPSVATSV